VARGIHHFITSSGQKAKDTFVEGSSPRIVGTESFGISFRALSAARLFGAFDRMDAALTFFLGAFVILANAPQGGPFRPLAPAARKVRSPHDVRIHSTLRPTVPTLVQSLAVVKARR